MAGEAALITKVAPSMVQMGHTVAVRKEPAMDTTCTTCATLLPNDRCPFHTDGARKLLSTVPHHGAEDSCPHCGKADIDALDGFYDLANRPWHATCAVIALRS
jgi:RNA polymerase subunit RPABC4/transcription elongation factor Spt4